MKHFSFLLNFFLVGILSAQNFTKITTGPLVTTNGDSRSVNWIDVNNDNFIDCQITNGPSGGQNNLLFINTGAGNFTALTGDSIVLDNKPSDGATWGDTDNDGDLDCFVANWYGVNNLSYLNNGSGNFTRVNTGTYVNDGGFSETASWGDYDNDGLLDLYVTNSAGNKKNFLYHNLGANTYTKITAGLIVNDGFSSRSVNWTDIDGDNDLDVFVSNETSQNENIYRNDGSGNFTKLTGGVLLSDGGNTMSSSWGDIDNDGDLDVFLANDLSANALFINNGGFNFSKVSNDTVVKGIAHSFSSAWSDIDNDTDLDLFVTNSFSGTSKLVNHLYLNNGSGNFSRIPNAVTQDSSWAYGCAFADYDNDGFEDLAVATCRFGGVDQPDLLYHNNGNGNNWITVKLVGTASNKAAIGTKIRVKAIVSGIPVWQLREISAQSSYCGQNDLRAHFGLGNATQVDSIKIQWPSGTIQNFGIQSINQFITIVEGGSVTGLKKDLADEASVSIFPNPTSGTMYIVSKSTFIKGAKLSILNINGKLVYETEFRINSMDLNIDLKKIQLSAGVYTVQILNGNEVFNKQMILQ
jgi:enediyne biosynthesis protein E4